MSLLPYRSNMQFHSVQQTSILGLLCGRFCDAPLPLRNSSSCGRQTQTDNIDRWISKWPHSSYVGHFKGNHQDSECAMPLEYQLHRKLKPKNKRSQDFKANLSNVAKSLSQKTLYQIH